MKFLTLAGRTVSLNIIPSKFPIRTREQCLSAGQFNLGRQLQKIYPNTTILEEFPIPGSRMHLDFYVPSRSLVIEFDGTQHSTFNKFFHKDKASLENQRRRDNEKSLWCELNSILLVRITDPNINLIDLRELIIERSQ